MAFTNFFGQGENRGLLGKLTDWMRNGYYDPGSGVVRPDPVGQQQDIAGNWYTPRTNFIGPVQTESEDIPANGPAPTRTGSTAPSLTGDVIELPTWLFEGNVFTNLIDYLSAQNSAIDRVRDEDVSRAQEDTGRNRSRFLEQIMSVLGDIDRGEKKGQADISSYYSNLGDIYQSSEDTRRGYLREEVDRERSRVGREKEQGLSDIDRALNDYIQGRNTAADQAREGNFSSALEIRNQLAAAPGAQLRQANPTTGAAQLSDSSALLRNLNEYLTPANLRRRYNASQSAGNPITSYLNPAG